MKSIHSWVLCFLFLSCQNLPSQEIIALPITNNPLVNYENAEQEYYSETWSTEVVTNVSKPSMAVFRPKSPNGTAIIVCPGGGLYAHSINSEGNEVAKWLASKGYTAFVLRYSLVPTGEDGVQQLMDEWNSVGQKVSKVLPVSIKDGLNAIQYIREHAVQFSVAKNKIGIMGFSAGGAVTKGTAYEYDLENRPDFIAPVYAWMDVLASEAVPADAPPMFVLCAADDPLGLGPASVDLYKDWIAAGKTAELHMYAQGGHGFGMKTQNLPTDNWIELFGDWLGLMGF